MAAKLKNLFSDTRKVLSKFGLTNKKLAPIDKNLGQYIENINQINKTNTDSLRQAFNEDLREAFSHRNNFKLRKGQYYFTGKKMDSGDADDLMPILGNVGINRQKFEKILGKPAGMRKLEGNDLTQFFDQHPIYSQEDYNRTIWRNEGGFPSTKERAKKYYSRIRGFKPSSSVEQLKTKQRIEEIDSANASMQQATIEASNEQYINKNNRIKSQNAQDDAIRTTIEMQDKGTYSAPNEATRSNKTAESSSQPGQAVEQFYNGSDFAQKNAYQKLTEDVNDALQEQQLKKISEGLSSDLQSYNPKIQQATKDAETATAQGAAQSEGSGAAQNAQEAAIEKAESDNPYNARQEAAAQKIQKMIDGNLGSDGKPGKAYVQAQKRLTSELDDINNLSNEQLAAYKEAHDGREIYDDFMKRVEAGPNMSDYFYGYHGPTAVGFGLAGASVLALSNSRGQKSNAELYSDPFA